MKANNKKISTLVLRTLLVLLAQCYGMLSFAQNQPDSIGVNTNSLDTISLDLASPNQQVLDTSKQDSIYLDTVSKNSLIYDTIASGNVSIDTVKPNSLALDSILLDSIFVDTTLSNNLVFDTISLDSNSTDKVLPDSLVLDTFLNDDAASLFLDSIDTLSTEEKRIKDSLMGEHLELLSNINCNLSNSWTINLRVNGIDEEGYKSNAIKSYLFTYKTRKDGRNSGVIMNFYDIGFKDTVLADKKPSHSSIATHFFYTKNYVVYINHGKNVNEIYDNFMPVLLEELKTFFESNKDIL